MAESFHLTSDWEGIKVQGHHSDSSDTAAASRRKQPSKWQLGWFFLFSLCALGLTLALSFSCSSVTTSSLRIYSIRPARLIQPEESTNNVGEWTNNLDKLNRDRGNRSAPNASNEFSPGDFGLQRLPDRYLFGISGMCRQWTGSAETNTNTTTTTTNITCNRHFPQVPSLLQAVLEDAGSATARDSWKRLLTSKNTETEKHVALWKRLVSAAGAMLIMSIFWAVGLMAFTAIKPQYFMYTFFLAIVDAVMALTAAVLWTTVGNLQSGPLGAAMQEMTSRGPARILEEGLGIRLLWALVLCKLVVTPLMALILFLLALASVYCCCAAVAGGSDKKEVRVRYPYDYYYWAEYQRRQGRDGRY